MKAIGPGLKGGLVGNPAEFTIDTKGAGTGGLGLTVEGPTEAKIECSDNGDGTCSVSYLPTEPGDYLVNILFENVHIPGSPFRADIQMPFDPSKVVASGSGLKRGKVREMKRRAEAFFRFSFAVTAGLSEFISLKSDTACCVCVGRGDQRCECGLFPSRTGSAQPRCCT